VRERPRYLIDMKGRTISGDLGSTRLAFGQEWLDDQDLLRMGRYAHTALQDPIFADTQVTFTQPKMGLAAPDLQFESNLDAVHFAEECHLSVKRRTGAFGSQPLERASLFACRVPLWTFYP